jgi:hypothetical protein
MFFGLEYENLSTSTTGVSGNTQLDASLPVHCLKLTPGWYPISGNRYKLGLGAGVGIGYFSGKATLIREGLDDLNGGVRAASLLLETRLSFDYSPVSRIWFVGSTGYRDISFKEVEVEGVPLTRDDNHEIVPFDFGGWYIQLGVKWDLPQSDYGNKSNNGI